MTKKATRMSAAKTVVATTGLVAIFGAAAGIAAPVAAETSTTSTSSEALSSTVRKSVTMSGDADGTIKQTAMVTQVSAVGDGNMTVDVPIGADSVRNLDGFGSVPVDGQSAVFNLDVNGSAEQRTYSTAEQDVLAVKAKVTLDGKPIDAKDVVGKSGLLDVEYTVVNSGKSKQTVTYQDASGNTITEEQEVDLPIGGSVEIILPQGFNEITAQGANIGGNGTGATKLTFSLVLFKPLGNPVSTFSYQTRITDGTLPSAEFTFLPIVPLDNPSVVTAKNAFTGGAEVGTKIYDAGTQISENLMKLQDGAAQLLAGLTSASSGASQLAAGLNDTAVPGAKKLEKGAGQLSTGLNEKGGAVDGSRDLAKGVAELRAGVKALPQTVQKELAEDETYQGALSALGVLQNGGVLPNPAGGFLTVVTPLDAQTNIAILAGIANTVTASPVACGGGPYGPKTCDELKLEAQTYIAAADAVAKQLEDGLPVLVDTLVKQIRDKLLGSKTDPGQKGVYQAAAGAKRLADGLVGAGDGASQLADGTTKLADGLVGAADGASQLADGLPAAVEGIAAAEAGAEQLRVEGSEKLATTGETAQEGYALQVGQINALQQVGLNGAALPYGPATATGGTVNTSGVYQLTLAAAPSGSSNAMVFGLAALGLIAGGAVGVWAYRRRTA